ncbi:MAG: Ser-Thr-rich GPI-anchored membrane family protein [Acidobacteriota bacterium]
MKKLTLAIIVTLFIAGLLVSQNITVTSPGARTAWHTGDTVTISWTSSRCTDSNIKINIFRNSIAVENFVEQLLCAGCSSKRWTIPASYADGNYILRVKTADGACRGDSGVFTISTLFVSTGNIEVFNPTSSTSFMVTQWALSIAWGNTGLNHENVSIEVIPEGNPAGAMVVTANTPNDDEYEWRSPGSFTGAGRFFIRVKTLDGAVWGDSEIYEVNALPVEPPVIVVTGPGSSSIWNVGSPRMIYWRKVREMNDRVKIKIYDSSGRSVITNISDNTENDEEEHWMVPSDHPAGRYIMRITTIDNEVTGDSGIFNITRPDDPVTPPPPPRRTTINVKSPDASTTWRGGQKATIQWSGTPTVGVRVRIELFKKGVLRAAAIISAGTENDGEFKWKTPVTISTGEYIVKITEIRRGGVYGISKTFVIKGKFPKFKLK